MSVPVALCGKIPSHVGNFIEFMAPEYEVVHVFHSTSAASSELPSLLKGENVRPVSRLGSNAHSASSKTPHIIIVGGGFNADELAEMRTLPGASGVPWMHNDPARLPGTPGIPSPQTDPRGFMESTVKRVKVALKEQGLTEGKGKGEVWQY